MALRQEMQNMVDLLAGSLLHGGEVRRYANARIGEGNVLSWHHSKPSIPSHCSAMTKIK